MEVVQNESLINYAFKAEIDLEKAELTKDQLSLLGKTNEKIIESIKEHFEVVQFTKNMSIDRFLTDIEIAEARETNLDIIENKLPEYENELSLAEVEAKRILSEARGNLNSYISQSKELAKFVKEDTKEVNISAEDIYRIAYNGHFIYLRVNEDQAKTVKVEKISEDDLEKWYNQQDQLKSQTFFNQNNELEEAK